MRKPASIVLIGGASCSGKTSLARQLTAELNKAPLKSFTISMDNYYIDTSALPEEQKARVNYDNPSAIDWAALKQDIEKILGGEPVMRQTYNYVTGGYGNPILTIDAPEFDVIIIEGIFALHDPIIRSLANLSVALDIPVDICALRRAIRDSKPLDQGGLNRPIEETLLRYEHTVSAGYTNFIAPSLKNAQLQFTDEDERDSAVARIANRIAVLRKPDHSSVCRVFTSKMPAEYTAILHEGHLVYEI